MGDLVFALIVLVRVGVPLGIPRVPLPAIIAALVVDAADQTVLAAFDAEPVWREYWSFPVCDAMGNTVEITWAPD